MSGHSPSDSSSTIKTLTLFLICIIQIAGVFYYAHYFDTYGYLPSPFIYDKSDSFMDLFNTMWWADNGGVYADWGSVYPPLNFLLLQLIKWGFLGDASFSDPFVLRDAAFSIEIFFACLYLITPVLVLRTGLWKDFSLTQKVLVYLAFVMSTPMLFALERGNLIIFTMIFLALALSNPGIVRSFSIAILINLKPYFALLLIHYAIKRRWDDLLLCIAMSALLYLITGLLLNDEFLLFFENLFNFSQNENIFSLREIMSMPSSISAFSYVLNSSAFQGSAGYSFVGNPAAVAATIEITKWIILAMILLALISAHKRLSDEQVIAVLTVAIINLGIWVGGYSMVFYVALVPVFYNMQLRRVYLGILLLLFTPINIIPLLEESLGLQYSYLADKVVQVDWTLELGSIAMPLLNLLLLTALSYEIIFKNPNFIWGNQFPSAKNSLKLGVR